MPGLAELRYGLYGKELQDPRIFGKLVSYAYSEVGHQGKEAIQAFIESTLNRAAARGKNIDEILTGSYFPSITHTRAARGVNPQLLAAYKPIVDEVMGGSNITNFATGNASGKVGFAGGPQTYAAGPARSRERFGVEGPDMKWAIQQGYGTGPALSSNTYTPVPGGAAGGPDIPLPRPRPNAEIALADLESGQGPKLWSGDLFNFTLPKRVYGDV